MQTKKITFLLFSLGLIIASCTSSKNITHRNDQFVKNESMDISQWPLTSQRIAKQVRDQYGEPSESTPNILVWSDVPPYQRILVYREQVPHNFPVPHEDVIEHVISFKIPMHKAGELMKFNGSLKLDRTRGEISARSENAAMNLLALNMAYDIITNKKDYTDARSVYGKLEMDYLNGNKNLLTQSLQFFTHKNAADPDKTTQYNWPQAQEAEPEAPLSRAETQKLLKQAEEEELTE